MKARKTKAPVPPLLGATLVAAALLGLAGSCGVGTAAIVSGASGGSTTTVVRTPTDVVAEAPTRDQSGRVHLRLNVTLDPNESVRMERAEFSLNGAQGTFYPATAAEGFPTEIRHQVVVTGSALAARAKPILTFVWNSDHDIDRLRRQGIIGLPASGRTVLRFQIRNLSTNETFTDTTGEFLLNQALVSTWAGGGAGDGLEAGQASMLEPRALAMDGGGDLLVADSGNHRIRRVELRGASAAVVDTVVGNGFKGVIPDLQRSRGTSMDTPFAIAMRDDGVILSLERSRLNGTEVVYLRAASQEAGLVAPVAAALQGIEAIAVRGDSIYVVDEVGGTLYALDDVELLEPGITHLVLGSAQRRFDGFAGPRRVAVAPGSVEEVLYLSQDVAGQGVERIDRLTLDGNQVLVETLVGGPNGPAPSDGDVGTPATMFRIGRVDAIVASAGHLFFCDAAAGYVAVVSRSSGRLVNVIRDSALLASPNGLALDDGGRLFIADGGDSAGGALESGHRILVVPDPLIVDEVVVPIACHESDEGTADGEGSMGASADVVNPDQGGG